MARRPYQTIQEQFEDFHAAHPDLYAEIVRLARVVKAAGFSKVGIAIISPKRTAAMVPYNWQMTERLMGRALEQPK